MNIRAFNVLLGILIIINGFLSVNQWSSIPLADSFFFKLTDGFGIIGLAIWFKYRYFRPHNKADYRIIQFYFLWLIFCVLRGTFIADNYWEWKFLGIDSTALSLPVLVYVFASPSVLQSILRKWLKYGLPFFFIFFYWVITPDAYQFYLGPILLLSCFLPILNRKWQLIFTGVLLLLIFADFGARSQVIKATCSLLMSGAYIISRYFAKNFLKVTHWLFYICPVVLLALGITGIFNPFEALAENKGRYTEKKVFNGEAYEDDLSADTRTFIYQEVITSAIKNDYVIWGRTPARGNDSKSFGKDLAEELRTGKYERYKNEVCFPNVFTWLGLIGMLLYCFIYLKASYLAVFKSKNIFIKLVGVFIAFRFGFGWIEDTIGFDIMNISLWMMIAMGFSEQFRGMNDYQFKSWVKNII